MSAILNILTEDNSVILYRPQLRAIAQTVTATILLSQIIYWDNKMGGEEFYKFLEPCDHPNYQKGSSWTEELGITPKQFRTAFEKLEEQGIVSKRINGYHQTYYKLHKEVLNPMLEKIYGVTVPEEKDQSKEELEAKVRELEAKVRELEAEKELTNIEKKPQTPSSPPPALPQSKIDIENQESNFINVTLHDVVREVDKMGYKRAIAQRFFDYYEALGWKKGKSTIMDWRPLLRQWLMKEKPIEIDEIATKGELVAFFRRMKPIDREKVGLEVADGICSISDDGRVMLDGEIYENEDRILDKILEIGLREFLKIVGIIDVET